MSYVDKPQLDDVLQHYGIKGVRNDKSASVTDARTAVATKKTTAKPKSDLQAVATKLTTGEKMASNLLTGPLAVAPIGGSYAQTAYHKAKG